MIDFCGQIIRKHTNLHRKCRFVAVSCLLLVLVGCNHHNAAPEEETYTLPSLYITIVQDQLDSILGDRDHKAPAHALLISSEGDTLYNEDLGHIKTRGNASWYYPKKPFTIKLKKAEDILGLYKSKTYILLANMADESHIRNSVGFELARLIGIHSPKSAYVSLYINDNYNGLYQITNKIEVNKHSLNIRNLEKENKLVNSKPLKSYTWFGHGRYKQIIKRKGVLLDQSPKDITGSYLLDYCTLNRIYQKSTSGFCSEAGDLVIIRSPEYASPEEVEYIADYYNEMEKAVKDKNGENHDTGKRYTDYMDIRSFARYYLLQELTLNIDAGKSSFFMYKTEGKDAKLIAGPAWDFDHSMFTKSWAGRYQCANELYAAAPLGKTEEKMSGGLLFLLWQHEEFRQIAREEWNKDISALCHSFLTSRFIDSVANYIQQDAMRDKGYDRQTYRENIQVVKDFLAARIDFLDWFFNTPEENMIYLIDGSVSEHEHQRPVCLCYPKGKKVTLPTPIREKEDDPVYSWHSAATGELIKPNSVFNSSQEIKLE